MAAESDRGKLVAAERDRGKLVAADRERVKLVVADRDQGKLVDDVYVQYLTSLIYSSVILY